jgi:formate-dependent nitrite reductase cytochrome c552 subunit
LSQISKPTKFYLNMKKLFLAKVSMLMMVMVLIAAGCTKEGPQGPAGKDGTNGTNGTNGTDGTAGCIQCHDDSQALEAKVMQWETSVHATGGAYFENATGCAPCHTSQGFLERMAAGTQTTAAVIENPMPQNCYTCHNIHSTYTAEDLGLTYTAKISFWHTGGATETPDFGKGNLCANCHQSRIVNPWPVAGETVTISNKRYGPHHGPMAQVLGGFGGWEVAGSQTYSNSPHTTVPDACVTCHLGTYNAEEMVGGHNMAPNVATNCSSVNCHPDGVETEMEAMQEEITGLLAQLKAKMIEQGYFGEDDYLIASTSTPAILTANQAGAVFNYQMIREDKSFGVHNYKYAKALLTNSFESLSTFAAAK